MRRAATPWPRARRALAGALLAATFVACDRSATVEDEPTSRLDALRALPYVATVDAGDAPASGTILWDRDRASAGYNLYASRTSREAYLVGLDGRLVHRWFDSEPAPVGPGELDFWDAVELVDDGGLLAIRKFGEVVRLDRESRILWRRPVAAHHDLAHTTVGGDERIFVVDREFRRHRGFRVRFPGLVTLDGRGRLVDRWSGHDRLDQLAAALDTRDFLDRTLDARTLGEIPRLAWMRAKSPFIDHAQFDYFHLNTVKVIGESAISGDPRFRPGNLVLCFRNVHQVVVLDGETLEVTWSWGAGVLDGPHQPHLLADGTLLVFDNGRSRGDSRVLAVDPIREEVVWRYPGPGAPAFFSRGMGSAERLANGNTLICEALKGRVFEVTPEGEIVWEWLNPALEDGRREAVYRMVRVPPGRVASWLPAARSDEPTTVRDPIDSG